MMPRNPLNQNWTNWGFTLPFLLFFCFGIWWLSQYEQGDMLYFFGNHRTDFLNRLFIYGTKLGEEPMYAVLTIIALWFFSPRKALAVPALGFTIMGLSYLLKNLFEHKRPSMYFGELTWPNTDQVALDFNLIEGVTVLTGKSSFPSGHTMSGFGLFCLFALYLNRKHWIGVLCFIIALVVGLSRVYLFQHFFKDVLAGAALGWCLAHATNYISFKIGRYPHPFWDRPLRYVIQKTPDED